MCNGKKKPNRETLENPSFPKRGPFTRLLSTVRRHFCLVISDLPLPTGIPYNVSNDRRVTLENKSTLRAEPIYQTSRFIDDH